MESECMGCQVRQVLDMCRFVGADEATRQKALKSVMKILIQSDEVEFGGDKTGFMIQNELKRILDLDDPYKTVKAESIRAALDIFPKLKEIVKTSETPLRTAVEICIAGNVIDFGPSRSHDIEKALGEVLSSEKHRFDWDSFSGELKKTSSVLILADNAGETVFDRVLIDEIHVPIYYAVKSKPVLNDAILEDAKASGLEGSVELVENGSPMAGTVLSKCSQEFLDLFESVDLVISKGQANFETLVNAQRRIFFMFKVKCGFLSKKHGIPLNEYVLLDNTLHGSD